MSSFIYEPGQKNLHFIPYFASYGSVNSANLGLSEGLELQQVPIFDPNKSFPDCVLKYKSNVIIGTPSCWLSILDDPRYQDMDLSFITYPVSGGSPLSKEEEERINKFLHDHGSEAKLITGYGISEMGGCAITSNDKFNKPGSIGVILPGVDIKFRKDDGTIEDFKREKQRGELLLKADTLASGTIDGEPKVETIQIDGDTYYPSKDVVETDELGNIYYINRIDRMFNRYDGYNVYPLNIENMLKLYPEIKECLVIGEFDEDRKGNIPKAIIKLDDDFDDSKEEFIHRVVEESFLNKKENLSYQANFRDLPHAFEFVDEMPHNTMGKIDFHKLKEGDYEKDRYDLNVEEDNMSIKSYTIEKAEQKTREFDS